MNNSSLASLQTNSIIAIQKQTTTLNNYIQSHKQLEAATTVILVYIDSRRANETRMLIDAPLIKNYLPVPLASQLSTYNTKVDLSGVNAIRAELGSNPWEISADVQFLTRHDEWALTVFFFLLFEFNNTRLCIGTSRRESSAHCSMHVFRRTLGLERISSFLQPLL